METTIAITRACPNCGAAPDKLQTTEYCRGESTAIECEACWWIFVPEAANDWEESVIIAAFNTTPTPTEAQ